MSVEPVAHLARVMPPWSGIAVTQCGLDLDGVTRVTTADEVKALVAKVGQKRAAYDTCMTCADTWRRHGGDATWETDPASVLEREAQRNGLRWNRHNERRAAEADLFKHELHAIAMLVEAHRSEFDDLVSGLGETTSLSTARIKRRRTRWPQ